jgi:hypothetical protein
VVWVLVKPTEHYGTRLYRLAVVIVCFESVKGIADSPYGWQRDTGVQRVVHCARTFCQCWAAALTSFCQLELLEKVLVSTTVMKCLF